MYLRISLGSYETRSDRIMIDTKTLESDSRSTRCLAKPSNERNQIKTGTKRIGHDDLGDDDITISTDFIYFSVFLLRCFCNDRNLMSEILIIEK